FVEQHDRAGREPRVEELQAGLVRLVEIAVEVHEREPAIGVALERVVEIARHQLDAIAQAPAPDLVEQLVVRGLAESADLLVDVALPAELLVDLDLLVEAL